MGNASQSFSLDAAVLVVLRVIFARRVTCRAPSRVAPASSHAVRTKHVPLSRSVTHVKEAPPREGSRVGVGKDGARDCGGYSVTRGPAHTGRHRGGAVESRRVEPGVHVVPGRARGDDGGERDERRRRERREGGAHDE